MMSLGYIWMQLGPWWVWLLICGIYYYPYVVAWTGAKIAFIETVRAFRKAVREGHPFTFRSFICFMATEVGRVRTTLESEQWVYRIQPFNQMQLRLLEEISKAFEAMEDKATAGTVFHFGPLKLCRVEVSYRGFLMVEFQRKAAIGGTFNLTNHDGKNVTEKDFLGKWTMVCFGLTPYPDDLQKLAAAVDKIKENAGFEIVPIYISNDPVRDTVGPLHKHVKEFHPNVISLTGSLEEIKKVAHVYGVDHMIKTEEDSTFFDVVRFVHSVLFNRYIRLDLKFRFETSTVMCLMGPNRDYVRFFWMDSDAESLADAAIKVIEFKSKKKTVCWI